MTTDAEVISRDIRKACSLVEAMSKFIVNDINVLVEIVYEDEFLKNKQIVLKTVFREKALFWYTQYYYPILIHKPSERITFESCITIRVQFAQMQRLITHSHTELCLLKTLYELLNEVINLTDYSKLNTSTKANFVESFRRQIDSHRLYDRVMQESMKFEDNDCVDTTDIKTRDPHTSIFVLRQDTGIYNFVPLVGTVCDLATTGRSER